MKIRYQFSVEELRQIRKELDAWVARRYVDPAPGRVYWHLLAPGGIVAVAVLSGSFPIGLLSYFFFWGASQLTSQWRRVRLAKTYHEPMDLARSQLLGELELLADRVVFSNADLIFQHFWAAYLFFHETRGYFYLFFRPLHTIVAAKAAFATEADLAQFREELRARLPGQGNQLTRGAEPTGDTRESG